MRNKNRILKSKNHNTELKKVEKELCKDLDDKEKRNYTGIDSD